MLTGVLVDSREPEWVQHLTFGDVPVGVAKLEYGDVQAVCDDGELLAIERKTSDDLLNSLRDGRLFEQLAGLHGISSWAYLMICGVLTGGPDGKVITDRGPTGWSYPAVQAALLTAQELGAFVIHTTDLQFEQTVIGLGKRNRGTVMHPKPQKSFVVLTPGETVLASLPGIGMERVAALLAYSGSAAQALAYLTDMDLAGREHVPGIGSTTKANVRRALGVPDGQELALVHTMDRRNHDK